MPSADHAFLSHTWKAHHHQDGLLGAPPSFTLADLKALLGFAFFSVIYSDGMSPGGGGLVTVEKAVGDRDVCT